MSVTSESCIRVNDWSCTEVRPGDGIHPTVDEPVFAAAEQLHIPLDERIDHAPHRGGPAMNDAPPDPASEPADDSGQGLAMFVIFTGAVLIVTGAVALLALVGSWWMLGVAFAVYLAMTVVVLLTILHTMAGRTRATVARDRPAPAQPGRFDGRPQTQAKLVTERGYFDPVPVGTVRCS